MPKTRKLTDEQAQEIRDLYALTSMSYQALAERFEVNPSTIEKIIRRHSYKVPSGTK